MTEFPISGEALEAAARAMFIPASVWKDERDAARFLHAAKKGINAFLEEEGFEVERAAMAGPGTMSSGQQSVINLPHQRLVGPWRPSEEQ